MEKRKLRIIFTKGGSGSVTTKMSIPSTWVNQMGISELLREVNVTFDGEKITIEKYKTKGNTIRRWGDLSKQQQEDLLKNARGVSASGEDMRRSGECIIDLTDDLSVGGEIVVSDNDIEFLIDDAAILYNPVGV